jgi:hypothetical protein
VSHPRVENETPFPFAPLFLADTEGRPLFVPLVKASYSIEGDGVLRIADVQMPVSVGGEFWGQPGESSYRYEPEGVVGKPASDVVLLGHAYPAERGARETLVGLRVGPIRKMVRVVGDRSWVKLAGAIVMTDPQPFERIPLVWERAFGGWDRGDPDPGNHRCESRNPVGTGFRRRWNDGETGVALPNLEDPAAPIRSFRDRPRPVGFGFVSPDWQPRLALTGTYDETWMRTRMPLVPGDFDPRFLNAAPADQVVAGHLRGDEEVAIVNASSRGRLQFRLPGSPPPAIDVELRSGRTERLAPRLDTLIIDTDAHQVACLWRAALPVRDIPRDIVAVVIHGAEGAPGDALAARVPASASPVG